METPTSFSPTAAPDSADLQAQVASLNKLCTWLLFSTLLIGGSFGVFLWHQVRGLNRQITDSNRFIADYQTNSLPKIKLFVGTLQTFAKTNSDFNPILAKYGLMPTSTAAPAKPPTPPAAKK